MWMNVRFRRLALALIVFIAATTLAAQTSTLDGRTVARIDYVPIRQPISAADLKRVVVVSPGAAYSAKHVAESIDRMFATGAYLDIQVEAQPAPAGLVVTFHTQAAPFVGHVTIDGKVATPPSRSTLLSTGDFPLGAPFDPNSLASAEKTIRQLFTSNGLYTAEVHLDSNVDPNTNLASITIKVHSGKRARFEAPDLKGDLKLADESIIKATGWRVILIHRWKQVTHSLTQKGVENVRRRYQKEDRLAATVDLDGIHYDPKTNRAKATLSIDAGPKISVKTLEAKVSKGDLKKLVPVYEEGEVDNDLLFEGARNLRDHFQADGYPDVDVTFRIGPLENDERTIEYVIAKGARQKLAKLEIQGCRFFDEDTIRERIFLMPASLRFRRGRFSEAYMRRDVETIQNLYRNSGFRDVKVTTTVNKNYRGKAGELSVTYRIDEGKPWAVGRFAMEGFDAEDAKFLRDQMQSIEGQPYAETNVVTDRSTILKYYDRLGYSKASLQIAATPADQPNAMDLKYVLLKGPKQSVSNIQLLGLTRTHTGIVNRRLAIHPGDPLSPVRIESTQRALDDLGIFERVDGAIQNPEGDQLEKTVLFDIQEANRYSVRVGVGAEIAQIGASTNNLSAPVGGTGFSPRFSLNVARINFLGLGHRVDFDGRVSNLEQRLGLNYTLPNFLGSHARQLTFSTLYDKSSNVRTFTSRREEAAIQLSQKINKPSTILFRYAYRRVSTSNVAIPDLLIPQLVQPVRIGIFSVNYANDRRDNPASATRGMYNTVDLGIASNLLGSQRTFGRLLARNATYHRIRKDLILARQLEVGLIQPFRIPADLSSSTAVPLPERFFGGGNLTHRGFGENQAGPRDIGIPAGSGVDATQPTGFPLGGNAVLFHNTELRFPLLGENIGGVLFHDMGNVYRTAGAISFRFHQRNDQDFDYMVHAAGLGIRYKTPIGPVRADLAYSINPPRFVGFKGTIDQLLTCDPSKPPDQLPGFCTGVSQRLSHFQFFFSIGQTF